MVSISDLHSLSREKSHCLTARTRVSLRDKSLEVPLYGLGTGSPEDDPSVIAEAIRRGHAALIDTGELYGNEEIIQKAIASSGTQVVLSSKHGTWCEGELPEEVTSQVPDEYKKMKLRRSVSYKPRHAWTWCLHWWG